MSKWHKICETYCDYLYQEASSAINYSKKDTVFWQEKLVSLTYGEILYPSLMRFRDFIDIKSDDILLDCGAGMGKACIQLFLQGWFKEIIGIEANKKLSEVACTVAQKLRSECPDWFLDNQINLTYGNFLQYYNKNVTVMYTCSTCFSEDLMDKMGSWMNSFPKLRFILSLKPIPNLTRFKLMKTKTIQCSWDSSQCFIYGSHLPKGRISQTTN